MRHVLHTMYARMKETTSISLICFLFVAPVPWWLRYKLFLKPFPTPELFSVNRVPREFSPALEPLYICQSPEPQAWLNLDLLHLSSLSPTSP